MEIEDSASVIDKKPKQAEDVITSASAVDPLKSSQPESDMMNDYDWNHDPEDYEYDDDDLLDDLLDGILADDDFVDEDVEFVCDYDDGYVKLQAQFDNAGLPPGVEASVPWMENLAPSEAQSSSVTAVSDVDSAATGSKTSVEPSSSTKKEEEMDDALRKLMYFKQFDIIEDFSDHHFLRMKGQQPLKSWAKKIQEEWKILEQCLPETIYVRVSEARMDLLRAAIIGPAGTPYHDGLFFFDAIFPPTYPSVPPEVYYYSFGLRLNPNLYECGKVCLSLLGTWTGKSTEKWLPEKSTMLQVLVSIQALILNEEPFFNEPGYERAFFGAEGSKRSKKYNKEVFLLSLKTMLYTIRRPLKHFEDLIVGHFRLYAHDILTACAAYSEGVATGSDIRQRSMDGDNVDKDKRGHLSNFKEMVRDMIKILAEAFIKNGAQGCEKFLDCKAS